MRHALIFCLLISTFNLFGSPVSAGHPPLRAQPLGDTIVITDIDDTVRLLGVKAYSPLKRAAQFFDMNTAFFGMSQLLGLLEVRGAKIIYVSGVPQKFAAVSQKFLDSNYFPAGPLHAKPTRKMPTYDFKVAAIKKILETEHTSAKVIFIGDNGEKDIAVYDTISKDPQFSKRIVGTFIHTLYEDSVSQPLAPSQTPWLTAGDLALKLYDGGFVSFSTLLLELDLTIKALSLTEETRTLVIPEFTCVRPELVESLRQRASSEANSSLRLLLMELAEQIASNGKQFFGNNWIERRNCAPHEFSFAN